MDGHGDPLVPYSWDPTEGMTPEERLGFELISGMEGRLVTDDTFRAHTRAIQKVIDRMKLQLVITRFVAAVLLAAALGLAIWAKTSASAAREVSDCNERRLEAVSTREIPKSTPDCDMTQTRLIVERAVENARRQAELEREVARLADK